AGHAVHVYNSRPGLLRELGRESFDLILLDETLLASDMRPFVDRLFTLAGEDTALIFIHCSDDEHRLADALALGADDFIRRGVGNREIAARIDAVLRRRQPLRYQPSLDHPPYFFDLETRRCHLDGREVMLTDKEFELAVFLFQHLGRIFSRGHLLDAVWRGQHTQSTRTIDTHISRLRRKLQLTDAQGFRLASAYGSGYRLERFEPDGRNPAETPGHPAGAEAAERCPPVC
ncbi:response regulator transcription factor, partial [Zoogloea sp.]|uniref:response regulator transcription factor n=1 Tax=Zoogloea sp. TaxID=49181 RepID=UPI0025F0EF28